MAGSDKKTLEKRIQELGKRIIECNQICDGVVRNQKLGYYPRALFLEPSDSGIEVAVVGRNPGNSGSLEREFYRFAADCNKRDFASFKDCQRIWKAIAEDIRYYRRPRHLLEELELSQKGILWSEAVFCENKSGFKRPPPGTFEKCSERYLKEILKLVPEEKYVICLGKTAFECVRGLSKNNQHKVIGVYHPTGSRGRYSFANYFEEGKKVEEARLKREIFNEFKKLENEEKIYFKFLYTEPPFFRSESSQNRKIIRKLPHIFESVCTLNGCGKKFMIDRTNYRKPADDPRILHLREDHGFEGETRLGNRFKNTRANRTEPENNP